MLDYKKVVNLYDIQRVVNYMDKFYIELKKISIDDSIQLSFADDYETVKMDVVWKPTTKEYSLTTKTKEFDRMGDPFFKICNFSGKEIVGLIKDIDAIILSQ